MYVYHILYTGIVVYLTHDIHIGIFVWPQRNHQERHNQLTGDQ